MLTKHIKAALWNGYILETSDLLQFSAGYKEECSWAIQIQQKRSSKNADFTFTKVQMDNIFIDIIVHFYFSKSKSEVFNDLLPISQESNVKNLMLPLLTISVCFTECYHSLRSTVMNILILVPRNRKDSKSDVMSTAFVLSFYLQRLSISWAIFHLEFEAFDFCFWNHSNLLLCIDSSSLIHLYTITSKGWLARVIGIH